MPRLSSGHPNPEIRLPSGATRSKVALPFGGWLSDTRLPSGEGSASLHLPNGETWTATQLAPAPYIRAAEDFSEEWELFRRKETEEQKRAREETFAENFLRLNSSEGEKIVGEKRFNMFVDMMFNGYIYELGEFQRVFAYRILSCLAPIIFGADEWRKHGARINKKYGWTKNSKQCIATAPRQFGKSVLVGITICTFAAVMAKSNQAIFSTSKRTSHNLSDYARKIMIDSGYRHLIPSGAGEKTESMVFIPRVGYDGTKNTYSKMSFYPASAKISIPIPLSSHSPSSRLLSPTTTKTKTKTPSFPKQSPKQPIIRWVSSTQG